MMAICLEMDCPRRVECREGGGHAVIHERSGVCDKGCTIFSRINDGMMIRKKGCISVIKED